MASLTDGNENLLENVPNEPAGRLRELLRAVKSVPDGRTLSEIWQTVALDVIPARGDGWSLRAEAGALYSAVETAINALPADHDREAFRAYRGSWAKPIFGIGLTDSKNNLMSGQAIVSDQAIHTLSMLSSTLRSEAPEPRVCLSDDDLQRRLDGIYETLGRLHAEVSVTSWYDRRARSRLLRLITEAMDGITFIELRGFGVVERAALTIEGELTSSEAQLTSPSSVPDDLRESWLERIQSWLDAVRPIVRNVREMVEYDVVPLAGGVSVGLASGDVPAAIAAWVAGRVALEGRRPAPPVNEADKRRMLPPGESAADTVVADEPEDEPSGDSDRAGDA